MTPQQLKTSILAYALKGKLISDVEWDESIYVPLWSVTAWDKHFKNVDKKKQKRVIPYKYVLANEFSRLERPFGDVFLLSTGNYSGFTTSEVAGDLVSDGEVVTMPWGGSPTIKYFKGKFVTSDNRIATSLDIDALDNKFLYYFMLSQVDYLDSIYRGTSLRHPEMALVLEMSIPLPPIEKQRATVQRIEECLKLIDRYEKSWNKLEKFNKQFPVDMEKAILELAVKGKLVEQDSSDGNAKDLLTKTSIKTIKGVKDKDVEPITKDDIPFDIPDNWTWLRLGTACVIARGGSPRPIQEYLTDDPSGLNWIKIGDTDKNGKYIISTKEKIKPSGLKKTRMVHSGDFLLTNSMSFGRPYILKIDGCIHDGWLVISQPVQIFDSDFLYYLLSSSYAYNQFCGQVSGAVVKNLNSDKVANSIFPLPPLAEQKRIVAKLEELLPLCRKLVKQ